jgi:hypothetical protein
MNFDDKLKWATLICSIVMPIIVGFILFNLNRNKEYTFKKGDTAGEIFGNLFEFRLAVKKGSHIAIMHNKCLRTITLLERIEDETLISHLSTLGFDLDVQIGVKNLLFDKAVKAENQVTKIRTELTKHIGESVVSDKDK